MKKDRGPWILTYTGKKFYYGDPRPSDMVIEDMAHSLSLICRFGGHVKKHYSVAQHSVHISYMVPPKLALWGLLHDGTETWYIDLPAPLKHMPGMEFYRQEEKRAMKILAKKFKLDPLDEPIEVKQADLILRVTEQRDLMNFIEIGPLKPLEETIVPWESDVAEGAFLGRFKELTKRV